MTLPERPIPERRLPTYALFAVAVLLVAGLAVYADTSSSAPPAHPFKLPRSPNPSQVRTQLGPCSTGFTTPWGDCLRSAYVPYPAVPSKAPDGTTVGPTGTQGAQGQVGSASFAQGSPTTLGVSLCIVFNCVTTINQNTFWANQSYSALGNISVQGPYTLTIYNAVVVFYEPASGKGWSRGINVSSNGVVAGLVLTHGTVIEQVNNTGNAWFLGSYYRATAPAGGWWHNLSIGQIYASNATISLRQSGTGTPLSPNPVKNRDTTGFLFTSFNYSTFDGLVQFNSSDGIDVYGWSSHSQFNGGAFVGFDSGNDRFAGASMGFASHDAYNRTGVISLNSTSIVNQTTTSVLYMPCVPFVGITGVQGCQASVGATQVFIDNDLFQNDNVSYLSNGAWCAVPTCVGGQRFNLGVYSPLPNSQGRLIVVENDLFSNLTDWGTGAGGSTNYLASPYGYVDAGTEWFFEHNTVTKVRSGNNGSPQDFTFLNFAATMTADYNAFSGIYNTYHSEPIPLSFGATNSAYVSNVTFYGNVVQGFGTTYLATPLSQQQMNYRTDYGAQEYFDVGGTNGGGVRTVSGNFFANISGQAWFWQDTGKGDQFTSNVMVNLTTGAGIGVSVETGSLNSLIANNTCYGLYNYSYCVGSDFGGAAATNYTGNLAYDMDLTSYALWNSGSSESIVASTVAAYYATNGNGSNAPGNAIGTGPITGVYTKKTTVQTFLDSTVMSFNASGLLTSSYYLLRSVLGTDFNFTVENSYLPFTLYSLAVNVSTVAHASPTFLKLEGYAGIFGAQTYALNSSTISLEPFLPVVAHTPAQEKVAQIPANAGRYLYKLTFNAAYNETMSVNSAVAPNAAVLLQGAANTADTLTLLNASSYAVLSSSTVNIPSNGTYTATFNASTEHAGVIFVLSPAGNNPVPVPTATVPIWAVEVLLVLLVLLAVGVIYSQRKR